jgi:cytochrome c553
MRHLASSLLLPALAMSLLGCTDRMVASADRWSRSGGLIAVSGGEAGARYACISCHGARGEGNGFDAPRLAGLPTGYLQKQMEDYAAGLRPHRVMQDVARFLDSHERVAVAGYYAALPPPQATPASGAVLNSGAVPAAGHGDAVGGAAGTGVAAGAGVAVSAARAVADGVAVRAVGALVDAPPATVSALYARACQQCHGGLGEGTPAGPPLAGQPAFYLGQQLQDWQVGKRRNDGRHEMLTVARQLKPEEVRGLSLHLARLPIPPRPAGPAR